MVGNLAFDPHRLVCQVSPGADKRLKWLHQAQWTRRHEERRHEEINRNRHQTHGEYASLPRHSFCHAKPVQGLVCAFPWC